MKDRAFITDAEKIGLDITPATGERVQEVVQNMYRTPERIVERLVVAVVEQHALAERRQLGDTLGVPVADGVNDSQRQLDYVALGVVVATALGLAERVKAPLAIAQRERDAVDDGFSVAARVALAVRDGLHLGEHAAEHDEHAVPLRVRLVVRVALAEPLAARVGERGPLAVVAQTADLKCNVTSLASTITVGGLTASAVGAHYLATDALLIGGSESQKQRFLPAAAAGKSHSSQLAKRKPR
jgi:hypothetical protein